MKNDLDEHIPKLCNVFLYFHYYFATLQNNL